MVCKESGTPEDQYDEDYHNDSTQVHVCAWSNRSGAPKAAVDRWEDCCHRLADPSVGNEVRDTRLYVSGELGMGCCGACPGDYPHIPIVSGLYKDGKQSLPVGEPPGIKDRDSVTTRVVKRIIPTCQDVHINSVVGARGCDKGIDLIATMTVEDVSIVGEVSNRSGKRECERAEQKDNDKKGGSQNQRMYRIREQFSHVTISSVLRARSIVCPLTRSLHPVQIPFLIGTTGFGKLRRKFS